jgi:hypothetical protein
MLQLMLKTPYVGHTHAVREMFKHDLIVGGVAHINPFVKFLL